MDLLRYGGETQEDSYVISLNYMRVLANENFYRWFGLIEGIQCGCTWEPPFWNSEARGRNEPSRPAAGAMRTTSKFRVVETRQDMAQLAVGRTYVYDVSPSLRHTT